MTKRGLIVTLMTVTFAFFRVSAYAEAPVITDPGDVIIGDLEQGAGDNVFVFPDAIGLDGIVSDDTTPDALIKWTYTSDGTYTINGIAPIDLLVDDPDNPTAGQQINGNDEDTAAGGDTDARTATFRNDNLSPHGSIGTGPGSLGPYADPSTSPGLVASETRTITLFASDCTTHSSISIVVYTSNDTSDSISGGAALIPVLDDDFDGDPSRIAGWFGAVLGGNATTGTSTGLCMWVAANNPSATSGVGWISPPNFAPYPSAPYITLVDKNVFRIRLSMYTDQTATGAIPFWTFGYNNLNGQVQTPPNQVGGGNTYGGDLWVLDVAGGANGINGPANGRPNGRATFDYWFCPNAALTAQWRGIGSDNNGPYLPNSAFDTSVEPINDMSLVLRILDGAQGANSIHNEVDTGTICCQQLRVDRIDIDNLASRTTLAYGAPISSSLYAVNPDSFSSGGNGTGTIDNPSNTATFLMGPNYNGGNAASLAGGRKSLIFFDATQVQGTDFNAALYPIVWNDDQLLQLKVGIRSGFGGGAGSTEGTDPVDVVFINFDSPTSEIGGFNFTQRSVLATPSNMFRAASPRLSANTGGSSQIYTSFFSTQNATDIDPLLPGFANAKRIRGYVDFINNNNLGSNSDGRDAITVDSMGLYTIDTNGFN